MPNTTAAIMALPAPLEQIRLVGDEEKHATLLFFGETSTLPNDARSTLTDAVKQASTMLFPFSESVMDVSRLGPESPPALVAILTQENLSQVRNLFMMNPSIKGYLDNGTQYPKFTPHVTLGYPDYTDETILRTLMKQIYRVRFDRLAVWWNDERIEFQLNGPEQDDISVAMSDITEKFLAHISEKPWSDYSEADYTLEQYANACLVAPPKAQLTSKAQCKLPVKTPDGALNRHGVHAAAAALAGARGGVKLSADERATAEKKLVGYYKELGEDAPASLTHALIPSIVDDFVKNEILEHHGIKGQKWGVRKDQIGITSISPSSRRGEKVAVFVGQRATSKSNVKPSEADVKNMAKITRQARDGLLSKSTQAGIQSLNKTVMKDLDAGKYQWNNAAQSKYEELVAGHMEAGAKAAIKTKDVTAWVTPHGNNDFMLHVGHKDAIAQFKKDAAKLGHATIGDVTSLQIKTKRDDHGLVVGFDVEDTPVSHIDPVDEFFEHHGVKGQKWGVRRAVNSATGLVVRSKKASSSDDSALKPRTSSEDQIHQDRIASKLASGGTKALSNRDIQDFTRRLQLQSDLDRVLAAQSATAKAKSDGFIKRTIKSQSSRQFNRVLDKTTDIAVEKALESAGLKLGKKGFNPDVADTLVKVSGRLAPKKKGK